jgi:hypothetical protein
MTLQKLFLQRQHSATGWMNLQMFFESEEGAHPGTVLGGTARLRR